MTAIFTPAASHRTREPIQRNAERNANSGVQHISEILPLILERIGAVEPPASAAEEAELVGAAAAELEPCLAGHS